MRGPVSSWRGRRSARPYDGWGAGARSSGAKSNSSFGTSRRKRDGGLKRSSPNSDRAWASETREPLPRAGEADVAEATLLPHLLVVAELVQRPLVGEDAVLHPGEEHRVELEPLRRVERHQRDPALAGLRVGLGHQADLLEERLQRRSLGLQGVGPRRRTRGTLEVELLRSAHELAEVLGAAERLVVPSASISDSTSRVSWNIRSSAGAAGGASTANWTSGSTSARNPRRRFCAVACEVEMDSTWSERLAEADTPWSAAHALSRSRVVSPMPRAGTLITRRRSASERGFAISRRYDGRVLDSRRARRSCGHSPACTAPARGAAPPPARGSARSPGRRPAI